MQQMMEPSRDPREVREQAIKARHAFECQNVANVLFDKQLALLAHGSPPTRLAFHPLQDHRIIVADARSRVTVWNWEENSKATFFVNGNPERGSGISGLHCLPQDRVMVASTDGLVRVWAVDAAEDMHPPGLCAAHQMSLSVGGDAATLEIDTFASVCYGVASEDRWLHAWDLARHNGRPLVRLATEGSPTALRASHHTGECVFVGFSSGRLSEFDLRSNTHVEYPAHTAWLVDLVESPGHHLISASVMGDLCVIDRRNPSEPYTRYDVLSGQAGLLTLSGHEALPVLAIGSTDQALRFLSLDTSMSSLSTSIHTVKYHDGLFGQRIGSPSCAAFHPDRPIYASGSGDSVISLYACTPKD